MPNHEQDPDPSNEDELFSDIAWEDDELDPAAEAQLEELLKPLDSQPADEFVKERHIRESVHRASVPEIQQRLAELRVEGVERINKHWLRDASELLMTPYILDDVQYRIYRRLKRGPFNRFVSVSVEQVFDEFEALTEKKVDGILLQREQNAHAAKKLIDLAKIEEGSIYENMTTPDGRFAVRSLYRLLFEDCMKPFTRILPKAHRRRADERPLTFQEVGSRAFHFLDIKIRQHASWDTRGLSTDQRLTYELIDRDLGRARAFALPVLSYLAKSAEQG